MKLRLGIFGCVLLTGALLAPSALAQKPVKEPFASEPLEFPAGDVCPFPVLIEPVASNQSIKTFPDGRMLVTGRGRERVTNLDSGESIVVTTSGSLLITPLPNGDLRLVARGQALFFLLPQDVGGPGLIRMRGRLVEVLDPEADAITAFRLRGQRTDVCAQLN
jgi:hypothetical protein